MLKIIDNYDLEDLKSFGFEKVNGSYRIPSKRSIMPSEHGYIKKHYALTVFKNRKIQISPSGKDNVYDILFDLFSEGIVEKC